MYILQFKYFLAVYSSNTRSVHVTSSSPRYRKLIHRSGEVHPGVFPHFLRNFKIKMSANCSQKHIFCHKISSHFRTSNTAFAETEDLTSFSDSTATLEAENKYICGD